MAALHQQRRKIAAKLPVNPDARGHGGGKHLRDRAFNLLDDVEFFDVAFAQLRVAHDLGDDPVGARDFLLDDFDLLDRVRSGVAQGALQRKGGAVDDGQRIFDLVGKFGGQPAGGTQLPFARGKFLRFLDGPPLAFPTAPARRNSTPSSAAAPPAATRPARPSLHARSGPARVACNSSKFIEPETSSATTST